MHKTKKVQAHEQLLLFKGEIIIKKNCKDESKIIYFKIIINHFSPYFY